MYRDQYREPGGGQDLSAFAAGSVPYISGGLLAEDPSFFKYVAADHQLQLLYAGTNLKPTVAVGAADQGWYQSAAGVLAAATAGVKRIEIDSTQIRAAMAGTAALPVFSTVGDPDTGVYFPGPNRLGLAVAGALCWEVDANGKLVCHADGGKDFGSNAGATGARANNGFFWGSVYVGSASDAVFGGGSQAAVTCVVDGPVNLATNRATGSTGDSFRLWSYAGTRSAGTLLNIGDGGTFTSKFAVNSESSVTNKYAAGTPGAPAAGYGKWWFEDNAGKGRLVVRFPSGANQVIANEP